MTWPVASFAVLTLALVVCFAWYERSRPSARTVALVATLAALAALGRVAFAPLPNVKPTTDIVLLSGYVLGGAPGFAVGAVSALASNVVFGQGPWTPWQMAAWGICGLAGAGLRRLTRGGINRIVLALACGALGLVYGAILDFSTWIVGTDHSAAAYGAVSVTSLPFNVAHAVGNVVFCLAFGPGLAKALLRFRDRLEARWVGAPPTPGGSPA